MSLINEPQTIKTEIVTMGEKSISRNTILRIKESIDAKAMNHEAIAQKNNVPMELVNDIASGKQYAWMFKRR